MIILFFVIVTAAIVLCFWWWVDLRLERAAAATERWCDISDKIIQWQIENYLEDASMDEFRELLLQELSAYWDFLQEHPYLSRRAWIHFHEIIKLIDEIKKEGAY